MEFRLLGGVAAFRDGRPVELGRRQERLLLAILLLEVNRVVSTDRLIELLWAEEPPAKPKRTLQVYYSRLRQALAVSGDVGGPELLREGDGYVLKTPADAVDVHRFGRLVEVARSVADVSDRAAHLRSALILWQGSPLAGVATPEVHRRLCAPLEEAYRVALELRIDAELAAGRHHEVLPELNVLVAEFPTRERMVAAKMLALHRADRSGEALTAYQELAGRLVRESGIDPGPQLQDLAAAIQGRTAIPTKSGPATPDLSSDLPHQLPPDVELLVDRDLLLAYGEVQLTKDEPSRQSAAIFCLYGGAGVGKSAAAVRLGHRIAAAYPDGQLFVRLVEPDGRPLSARAALGRLLRGLNVEPDQIADSLEARSAGLKEVAEGKEILLVLDDAQNLAQVMPLLQLGRRSGVIVTSRQPLIGLDSALHRDVRSLREDASLNLLRHVSGRQLDMSTQLATIIEYCGGLPLALRVIGARLGPAGGATVMDVAGALSDAARRLDLLGIGDLAVRSSLDLTLAVASPSTQILLQRIADLQLDEFSSWIAAVLLDVDESAADQEFGQLSMLGLIYLRAEHPSRYGMHNLIRTYAVERGSRKTDPDHDSAKRRYLDALVRLTTIADGGLDHGFVQTEGLGMPSSPVLPSIERAVAAEPIRWFRHEGAAVCVAVTQAAEANLSDISALLALRVRGYLTLEDDSLLAVDALRTALQALEGRGLPGLQARLLQAYFTTIAQHGDAIEELASLAERGLDLAQEDASPLLEMAAYWQLGYASLEACDFPAAAAAYETALSIIEKEPELEIHRAKALSGIGDAARFAGDPQRSAETLSAALELDQERTRWRAVTLFDLASALVEGGRLTEAEAVIRQAHEIFRGLGDKFGDAYVDIVDARCVLRLGGLEQARALLDSSLEYFLSIDDRTSLFEVRLAEAELSHARGNDAEARAILLMTESEALEFGDRRSAYQCRQLLATIGDQ